MEILVAMLVFSIIVSTVFLSHRAIFSSVGPMTDDMAVNSTAQAFLSRLTADLTAVYTDRKPLYKTPDFNAAAHPHRFVAAAESVGSHIFPRLRFAAAAHISMSTKADSGIAEIQYFVEPDGEGAFTVRRADRLLQYTPERLGAFHPAVCRGLRSLEFTFYDAGGDDHDRWNSEDRSSDYDLPAMVGVRFSLGDPDTLRIFESRIALNVTRGAAQ